MESNYIVSARKYRPQRFEDVVGQQALTTTLRNAVVSGKLAHAYLFCGPRGVGKTTCARIFAKAINCMEPTPNGEPCEHCESCQAFDEQRNFNIHELDAASNNSVEDIRNLISQAQIPPQVGRYKVFIIDEVHMLSAGAFNAFLKTLEEPPAHVIFILATTEKNKLLPTILSRCQIYDFRRMEVPEIVEHLKYVATDAGITFEDEALNIIAQKADGGMRDALSIFDQVAGFAEGNVTYKKVVEDLNVLDYEYYFTLTDDLLACKIPECLLTLDTLLQKGFDAQNIMSGLASHYRDLLVSRDVQTLPLLNVSETIKARYREQAQKCEPRYLYRALKLCNDCDINYRTSNNKRLLVELTLIQIAQLAAPEGEDGPSSGLGPTQVLKPIFHNTPAPQKKEGAAPTAPVSQEAASTKLSQATAAPRPSAAQAAPNTAPSQTGSKAPRHGALSIASIKARNQGNPSEADKATPTNSTTLGPQADENTATPQENQPFDAESLWVAWIKYSNQLPKNQKAMAERMKNMVLTIADSPLVEVTVDSESLLKLVRELEDSICKFLRTELHNSSIALQLKVRERHDEGRVYTQQDMLRELQKDDAMVQSLINELGLELA